MTINLLLAVSLLTAPAPEVYPRELLGESAFGHNADGRPDGWRLSAGVSLPSEAGKRILRLEVGRPGQSATAVRDLPLHPEWGVIRVSCRVRYQNIVPGNEGWHDGRIAMTFVDRQGQRVGPWPNVLHWHGTSNEWRTEGREYAIPEGAAKLTLNPALFSVQSGRLDLDEIRVTVLRGRPRPEDLAMPAAWKPASEPLFQQRGPREILSLNGVWQFRPMGIHADEPRKVDTKLLESPPAVPTTLGWGWTKAPSVWPETTGDSHNPAIPDFWSARMTLRDAEAYWYRRRVTIPEAWSGRRVRLQIDMPQTQAAVLVDGKPAGTIRWPGGDVDLTSVAAPGKSLELTLFVTAQPFSAEQLSIAREDLVTKTKATVRFHGLCGDLRLVAEPKGARIATVQYQPSVRQRQLGLKLTLADAAAGRFKLRLRAAIDGNVETDWTSALLVADQSGTLTATVPWIASRLWDLDQPNLYTAQLELLSASGERLDEHATRFGFREFWIDGRNLVLNGIPIHWRALFFANHQRSIAAGSKQMCRETFRRMRAMGFNFAILSNYGFDAGDTVAFDGLLEAADEEGFLLSFSMPHPFRSNAGWNSKYYSTPLWKSLADYCLRSAANHPSVPAYAMSHNTLGYFGDQNPAKMDGRFEPVSPKAEFHQRRRAAAEAEAYVRAYDPTREVYHHQSGNMGHWHTVNIYLNWSPVQERMEWLSHWAAAGVKPMFFVEWGLPHHASWGRHRYGPFIWRNQVSSEPLAIEYGASVNGDAAYALTADEERHIDRYERVYAQGKPFHITQVLGDYWQEAREHNFVEVKATYTKKIWPALRTWGISALLPWDQADVARLRPDARNEPVPCATPPASWREPGLHPDRLLPGDDYFLTGDASAFEPTSLGEAFTRLNGDVLMWIAGEPKAFTDQAHLFRSGETIEKQLVVLNDRRVAMKGRVTVKAVEGDATVFESTFDFNTPAGGQQRIPLRWQATADGRLTATLAADRCSQEDRFDYQVLAPAAPSSIGSTVYLWDPKGLTTKELERLRIALPPLGASLPERVSALVVGREAVTVDGPLPDLEALRQRGLQRVLVFEQSEAALSERLGFRTNTPSLRNVSVRTRNDLTTGMTPMQFCDWRGKSTLTPEQFTLPDYESPDPKVNWLGFDNTRVWKWGNGGQVASVVIEKPQRGSFLSILDGGFDLQYSPLLLSADADGLESLFCQMDVTARTEPDPAAEQLFRRLASWAAASAAPTGRDKPTALFLGDDRTYDLLRRLGARLERVTTPPSTATEATLVVGPEVAPSDLRRCSPLAGKVVLLFPTKPTLEALGRPIDVRTAAITHTPPEEAFFTRAALAGIGPAELHFRGRTEVLGVFPASITDWSLATGVIAQAGNVHFFMIDPREFDYTQPNKIYLKLTHNHAHTALARFLSNLGVPMDSKLRELWSQPVADKVDSKNGRWLKSYYLDTPVADDDPYRYNRW